MGIRYCNSEQSARNFFQIRYNLIVIRSEGKVVSIVWRKLTSFPVEDKKGSSSSVDSGQCTQAIFHKKDQITQPLR